MPTSKIFLLVLALSLLTAPAAHAAAVPHITGLRLSASGPTTAVATFTVTPREASCSMRSGQIVRRVHVGLRLALTCRSGRRAVRAWALVRDVSSPAVQVSGPSTVEATGALTLVAASAVARDSVDGPVAASCSADGHALSSLALGPHGIDCTAIDRRGNAGTAHASVAVVDTTPPTIIASPERAVAPGTEVSAQALSIQARDLADAHPRVSCSAPTPSIAAALTVHCTATDASGNASSFSGEYRPTATTGGTGGQATGQRPAPALLDATVGSVGSDAVMLPAPNDTVGWRLIGAPATPITKTATGYSYQASGWSLQASGHLGRLKENITVTSRQGARTWSWQLIRAADDAAPNIAADGSVHLGANVVIAPPVITDSSAHPLATAVRWQLAGSTLSLTLDDASLPLPYVIDPATTYPSAAFTGTVIDGALFQPGPQTWTFDFVDGGSPITAVTCYLNGVASNLCSLSSRSYTSAYLIEGRYTLDIYARTAAGTAWARSTITVDGSAPVFPAQLAHDAYQVLPAYSSGEVPPACLHAWEQPAKPEFSMNWLGGTYDLQTGIAGFRVLDNGIQVAALAPSAYGYHFSGLTEGSHTLRVEATNNVGQMSYRELQVVVDTTVPTLDQSVFSMGSFAQKPVGNVTFELPGSDDRCLRMYVLYITGRPTLWLSGDRTQYTVNLPVGNYSWRVVSFDVLGNAPAAVMQWRTLYVA